MADCSTIIADCKCSFLDCRCGYDLYSKHWADNDFVDACARLSPHAPGLARFKSVRAVPGALAKLGFDGVGKEFSVAPAVRALPANVPVSLSGRRRRPADSSLGAFVIHKRVRQDSVPVVTVAPMPEFRICREQLID